MTDWESQILFPARLLAGFSPEVQDKLQQAGAALYLMILEGLEDAPEPQGSPVARELRSLLEELRELGEWTRSVAGLEAVAAGLERLVEQTAAAMIERGQDPQPNPVPAAEPLETLRPFLWEMVKDSRHAQGLVDLADGLAEVARQPAPGQWLEAVAMDLGWIKTVLEQHVAPRGEVSGLEPGDSALCVLARRVADRLQEPLDLLAQGAIGEAQGRGDEA